MASWSSCAKTHRGNRRPTNEDSVLERPEARLWAVADGMGGHQAGDVASRAIVDALADIPVQSALGTMVDRVEDALLAVNDDLRAQALASDGNATIGSTVVVMAADGDVGVALWAGDSRLYRLRGANVELITRDHNPVCDLMDDGLVSESVAMNADTNIITRAIGGHNLLSLDVVLFDVRPGDTYLLCSDGLYREVPEVEMAELLRYRDVHDAVGGLVRACLAGEARDNVAVVVSRIDGQGAPA